MTHRVGAILVAVTITGCGGQAQNTTTSREELAEFVRQNQTTPAQSPVNQAEGDSESPNEADAIRLDN